MENKKSKADIRQEKIRSMLIAKDFVTLNEFCLILKSSEATIRNDLRYLEAKGLIKRTFGGALATGNTAFNSNLAMRSLAHKQEKDEIADYVVKHVLKSGMTIILDTGTTSSELAKKIIQSDLDLTVLTNSFGVAEIMTKSNKIKLYLAGGLYNPLIDAFNDESAQIFFGSVRADIFFLSVNGISEEFGFTVSGNYNTTMKKLMIKAANLICVTADNSKFNKVSLKVVCGYDDVDIVITDSGIDKDLLNRLLQRGVNIVLASL